MMHMTTVLTGMASVMNNTEPMGDRLIYGMQMTLTGLLTVFAVLGIIFFVMQITRMLLHRETEKPTVSAQPASPAAAPTALPAAPIAHASDDALIAVLTAAVAAVLADEAAAKGTVVPSFRVVSFQRSSRGRTWNGHR